MNVGRSEPPIAAGAIETWHACPVARAASHWGTDVDAGLPGAEAARRLAAHGPNRLPTIAVRTPLAILVSQFASPVIGVLFVAGLLSAVLGERIDAIAILAVLVVNGLIGYLHEQGAEKALAALRRFEARRASVHRDGRAGVIDAADLVPGDLIHLESGDRVPADARLVRTSALQTVEAALTGESAFVEKDALAEVEPSAALPERVTMVYAGTTVASGIGDGVVVATGRATELGRIATLVGEVRREPTPLQHELARLGGRLVVAAAVAVVAIFVLGLLRGVALAEMLPASVGLAVAAVPEGLPAVVTIALAIGVRRMARRNVLIRRLAAVETLGSTTVVCVDKTGTLTTGIMRAELVATLDETVTLDRAFADPASPAAQALRAAAGCSTATLVEGPGGRAVSGDPMEGALLLAAERCAVAAPADRPNRVMPFDAKRKRMSVVRGRPGASSVYVKGAPETVLPLCTHVLVGGVRVGTDAAWLTRVERLNLELAARGLRILATASRALPVAEEDAIDVEHDLTFLGYVGFVDPVRPDTAVAVADCRQAGIRPVMITGDQAGTALAVARAIGLATSGDDVTSGTAVAALSDDALAERALKTAVYARTSPAEKLRIVRALQRSGSVVAMTGDGVNDTPALRGADIGVAMGSGTDAAKDVASMVVLDDRFASIVVAIAEGRTVHENVRKCLLYVLSGNVGELLVIAVAIAAGTPLPLLPIQLLWVNLVTDSLPALALATDPSDADQLRRPPLRRGAGIADRTFVRQVVRTGVLVALCTLAAYFIGMGTGTVEHARTMAFSTLVVCEALRAFVVRSRVRTIWELGVASNPRLLAVGVATVLLQLLFLTQPWFGRLLRVVPLGIADLAIVGGLGLVPATILEVRKLLVRRRGTRERA